VLDHELNRLPEHQRGLIVLCDLEGLKYEQAAQALGWPMGTVNSRLARGRDRLRSRLIRHGLAPVAGDRRGNLAARGGQYESPCGSHAVDRERRNVRRVESVYVNCHFAQCSETRGGSDDVDKVIAHNALTQKEQSILLNAKRENPPEVSFLAVDELVGLNLKGTITTRTAVYDHRAGSWIPLDLSEPVSGELQSRWMRHGTVAYDAGRHSYTFSVQSGEWDHFHLGTITDEREGEGLMHPAR
jgi:hypothetical protein